MLEGRPSRTAERVAIRRAAHQLFDQPLILSDPLALRIIGEEAAAELRGHPAEEDDRLSRAMRIFMAVRSRFAEDCLAVAVERGVRQYVVLGAGLDTSAYRSPFEGVGLKSFEVDYPATQLWKRQRLQDAAIAIPDSLTFAPVDFETQTLADGLRAAGWDASKPSFFSWLGVTPYLTTEAIDGTLSFVASTPRGGGIAFDYPIAPNLLPVMQRAVYYYLAARVAKAGEPWLSAFDPTELVPRLLGLGFGTAEDVTPEALNARYCEGRADGLNVGEMVHMMIAWV